MNPIKITDKFWSNYIKLIKNEMIPFQWDIMHDRLDIDILKERDDGFIPSEKSHVIENFKIAAGLAEGDHYGWWFQDSDIYKWIEGVANTLRHHPDLQMEEWVDQVVDLIELAQEDDGYLNTHYQIKAPHLRFRRLDQSHELYCAGHLIEAAVAYYEVTKKDKLLKIACKFADCIDENFGPEEGKIHGADGHQEIELALVKLYACTNEAKYLKLSEYLLLVRGEDPEFYEKRLKENFERGLEDDPRTKIDTKYLQAHLSTLDQATAEGHAVRMVYMCTGMADVAYYTGNQEMLEACKRIWENIVQRRMYVIGGIGSTVHGEAFTGDYDLPNDTMYCETCAAIGLVYFAYSMLKNEPNGDYADILERALYNNVISGMALDGKHYFYVNPLEVNPAFCEGNPGKSHVKGVRPAWFGCACCPPNLARTISNVEKYIYTYAGDEIYIHLYMGHIVELSGMILEQEVRFAENADIIVTITSEKPIVKTFYFRIPSWTAGYRVTFNGSYTEEKGYLKIKKEWMGTEVINIQFEMPVLKITAHPKVRANVGKISIQRGPFIYCMEEADNGADLHLIYLMNTTVLRVIDHELADIQVIEGEGEKLIIDEKWSGLLYDYNHQSSWEKVKITLIPYYAWANRSLGEMQVWINQK